MQGPGYSPDEHREEGLRMRQELLDWLAAIQHQRDGANLLERIAEAQKRGDMVLLMQLMKEKQEVARKMHSFTGNQLKKNEN